VPLDFDKHLSISDKTHASLSGGSIVKIGDIVYFNCSTADNDTQEPVNRRFICINGQWIENEQDVSWTFGNNGTFPKCRKGKHSPWLDNKILLIISYYIFFYILIQTRKLLENNYFSSVLQSIATRFVFKCTAIESRMPVSLNDYLQCDWMIHTNLLLFIVRTIDCIVFPTCL
jgi:hypothetical protein